MVPVFGSLLLSAVHQAAGSWVQASGITPAAVCSDLDSDPQQATSPSSPPHDAATTIVHCSAQQQPLEFSAQQQSTPRISVANPRLPSWLTALAVCAVSTTCSVGGLVLGGSVMLLACLGPGKGLYGVLGLTYVVLAAALTLAQPLRAERYGI